MTLAFLFFVVALVLFGLAAFNVGSKINLVAAGLFFVTLGFLWPSLPKS